MRISSEQSICIFGVWAGAIVTSMGNGPGIATVWVYCFGLSGKTDWVFASFVCMSLGFRMCDGDSSMDTNSFFFVPSLRSSALTHVYARSPQFSIATAPTVPGLRTLSLPFLMPRPFSIRAAGSPRACLINANVMTPASTYFLPSKPLRPTLLISASASSAILCLASSTRSTGLFLGSGNADCGGACIMSPRICCEACWD